MTFAFISVVLRNLFIPVPDFSSVFNGLFTALFSRTKISFLSVILQNLEYAAFQLFGTYTFDGSMVVP